MPILPSPGIVNATAAPSRAVLPFHLHRPKSLPIAPGGPVSGLEFGVPASGWLPHRREGEAIDLLGPLGNGFSIQPATRSLLLVAGGIGVAPLALLAEEALRTGRAVSLVVGAQSASGLYPRSLLPSKAGLATVTEDGSEGLRGMAVDHLDDYAGRADQVFACGPAAMYRSMAREGMPAWQTRSDLSGNRDGLWTGSLLRLCHKDQSGHAHGLP